MAERDTDTTFREWAVLELMGHRRLAGLVSEVEVAGKGFLRVDVFVPGEGEPEATQLYSPNAVYAITPVSEATARRFAIHNQPQPVARWELPEIEAPDVDDSDIEEGSEFDGPVVFG